MDSVILTFLLIKWFMPIFAFKVFENAGYKWWQSIIPVYNYYIWLKIVGKPFWWLIITLIPFIGYFMMFLVEVETAKAYNKLSFGQEALAAIIPFIYLPYLGYKETYYTPDNRPEYVKSKGREWIDAIVFAVVCVGIIRMYMFEAYTIPSSSMEKTLLVGDYLFVDKLKFGARSPMTPIAMPFVHHTMPLTKDMKAYCDKVELKYYRYPAIRKIRNYDPIVFNYPEGDTVSTVFQSNASYYSLVRIYGWKNVNMNKNAFGKIVYRPVDKRENYIKRCIAIPGDTLQVIDGYAYINGVKEKHPGSMQFTYIVKTDGSEFRSVYMQKLNITEKYEYNNADSTYILTLSDNSLAQIKKNSIVKYVIPDLQTKDEYFTENCKDYLFPYDTCYKWTIDEYGPIYIPKKGDTLHLNLTNICLYQRLIDVYENNDIKIENGKIIINGKETDKYVTKLDYYWMMGDNRHNSADSRFWGFVPEDHIVGSPSFVWLSMDKNKKLFDGRIRWKKMFRIIK